jgi:hypothetical protein
MRDFFTIPDPDLSQESSVDPMGLQVIWTQYGQDIFGEKLTTIANDLRVFTFNLFHNHLINRLYTEYSEDLQQAKEYYKNWSTDLDAKTGLLIFLEDLVTWTFYEAKNKGNNPSVNVLGILGMSKARIAETSANGKPIILNANKRLGLLKNQLNLGMTGRYKGPMIKMGFFNRAFEIKDSQNPDWEKVNILINNWPEAKTLQDNILKLIVHDLFPPLKKDHPQISRDDLKSTKYWKKIYEGYLTCFGSEKPVKEIRMFWKDKLGLMSGAPAALYKEISTLKEGEFIEHYTIFTNSLKHVKSEAGELNKLESVLNVEPFLSHCEYLLRYLSQNGIKRIEDHSKDLQLLRDEIKSSANFNLSLAPDQLKKLFAVMIADGPLETWIVSTLKYHKEVMTKRGGNAWIDFDKEGNLKHYFAPSLNDGLNTIPKYLNEKPWWHTYYLETLRSINKGLN